MDFTCEYSAAEGVLTCGGKAVRVLGVNIKHVSRRDEVFLDVADEMEARQTGKRGHFVQTGVSIRVRIDVMPVPREDAPATLECRVGDVAVRCIEGFLTHWEKVDLPTQTLYRNVEIMFRQIEVLP